MTGPEQAAERLAGEGRRLARNSLVLAAGQAVSLLLGFGSTVLAADALGEAVYGVLEGSQRFVAFFLVVVHFGLHPVLVRAIAMGQGRPEALVGTVLVLRLGLGGGFLLLVAGAAAATGYLPEHHPFLMAFAALELLAALSETFFALLEGRERMDRAALVAVVRSVVNFAGVAAVWGLGGGLGDLLLAFLGARLAQLAALLAVCPAVLGHLRLRVDRRLFRGLLVAALPFVAIGFAFVARRSLDVVLLARLSTIAEVSLYAAAFNFLGVVTVMPELVQRALLPALSRLHVAGGAPEVARDTLVVAASGCLPAGAGLALLAPEALALYPSGEFGGAATALRVLSASLLFVAPSMVCSTLLTGAGRIWTLVLCNLLALLLQLVVDVALIPRLGAVGAAAGTVSSTAAAAVLFVVACRPLGFRFPVAPVLRQLAAVACMAAGVEALGGASTGLRVGGGALLYGLAVVAFAGRGSLERRLLSLAARRLGAGRWA